jgi:RHS repeat-associated protein
MSTQSNNFVYTPTSSGTYTWRFRRVCTGATAPASSYTVDNLKVSYVIPFTRTECPETDLAYRFGFNGKEDDRETRTQDYGFRIYNPQIGKFLSVDPLTKSYPWYTPYQFAGNKPIMAVDLDGLEEFIVTHYYSNGKYTGTTSLYLGNASDRKLGNTGVLQINMDESQRANLDRKYNSSTHESAFFTTDATGSWTNTGGQYSLQSQNVIINKMNANIKRTYLAPNSAKEGVGKLTPGSSFYRMEYDNSKLINGNSSFEAIGDKLMQNPDFSIDADAMASPENGTGKIDYNLKKADERACTFESILSGCGVNTGQVKITSSGTQKADRDGVLPNATEEVKSNYRGVNVTTEIKRNPAYD